MSAGRLALAGAALERGARAGYLKLAGWSLSSARTVTDDLRELVTLLEPLVTS